MLAALACLISCTLAKAFTQPAERKGGREGTKEGAGSSAETQGKRDTEQEKVWCLCRFFAMMQENFYYTLSTLMSVLEKHFRLWPGFIKVQNHK